MFSFKQKEETKQPKRTIWKRLVMNFLAIIMTIFTLMPSVVSASTSYYLSFTYMPSSRAIMATTNLSDVGNGVENHLEIKEGANYLYNSEGTRLFGLNSEGKNIVIPDLPTSLNESSGKFTGFDNYFSDDRDSYESNDLDYTLPFSFPGRHVGTGVGSTLGDGDYARNADATDQQQANWVGQKLLSGFNQILPVYHNAVNGSSKDIKSLHTSAAKIANEALNKGEIDYTTDGRNIKITFDGISEEEHKQQPDSNYIDRDFYRKINITGTSSGDVKDLIVPVAVNKGYNNHEDARMYESLRGNPNYLEYTNEDVYAISWQHMVMQAGYNASQGVTSGNAEELSNPSRVEKVLTDMFGGIADMVRTLLGMETITDLVFNKGTHGATSVRGTIPTTMAEVADFVYFLVLIVAILILLGSFVSMLVKSNLSVINPQMRVDMKDSIFNILVTFFILVVFQPIWNSLMVLNESLVQYFSGLSMNLSDVGLGLVQGSGSIGAVLLSLAFLVVEIWFNFHYIVRALTIMILYMFAPLMIVSIAYGGRYKMIFENWLKELLGALFIQTIHAAILGAVFAGLDRGLGGSLLWQFVILISIIPLSNMFRRTILNLGGDSIGQSAERAEKGFLTSAAIGGGLVMSSAGAAGKGTLGLGKEFMSNYRDRKGGGVGGGGGGSRAGGSASAGPGKLGDEAIDESGISKMGSEMQQEAIGESKAERRKRELNDVKEFDKDIVATGSGVLAAMETPEKIQNLAGAAKDTLSSDVAKETAKDFGSIGVDAAGGALTAGAMIGDVATDGGSSQAVLAAQRFIGKKKGGGNFYGPPGSEGQERSLMEQLPPRKRLEKLKNNGQVGENGELMNINAGDGKQIMTSSVNEMGRVQGGSGYQTQSANKEYENGSTSFTYNPGSDYFDDNPELKENLDTFSELSEGYQLGTLSKEDTETYNDIRQGSGIAEVIQSDGGYSIRFDHKALGWDGAETDGTYYQAKASASENKTLPNFNNTEDVRVERFNNMTSQYGASSQTEARSEEM